MKLTLTLALLALGCSDAALLGSNTLQQTGTDASPSETPDFLPSVEGTRWTYETSEDGIPGADTIITLIHRLGDGLVELENEGDSRSRRWLVDSGRNLSWQRTLFLDSLSGEPVSDQYYDPPALRFDYQRTKLGQTWRAPYTRNVILVEDCPSWSEELGVENLANCPVIVDVVDDGLWTVTGVDRPLSVPAGDFLALCHTLECERGSCRKNEICYARGVGKLTEEGDSKLERLRELFVP